MYSLTYILWKLIWMQNIWKSGVNYIFNSIFIPFLKLQKMSETIFRRLFSCSFQKWCNNWISRQKWLRKVRVEIDAKFETKQSRSSSRGTSWNINKDTSYIFLLVLLSYESWILEICNWMFHKKNNWTPHPPIFVKYSLWLQMATVQGALINGPFRSKPLDLYPASHDNSRPEAEAYYIDRLRNQ